VRRAGGERHPQRRIRVGQLWLSDHLVQATGAHPLRQGQMLQAHRGAERQLVIHTAEGTARLFTNSTSECRRHAYSLETMSLPPTTMLLERSFTLAEGLRVRLRLARPRDAAAVARLLGGRGGELRAGRLVSFDPRREAVVAATALIDGTEQVVGVGAIELGQPGPTLLESDRGGELDELIGAALRQRSAWTAGRHAA
jgi:hypothetical protein